MKEMVAKYVTEMFCFVYSLNSGSSGLLIIANKIRLAVQAMTFACLLHTNNFH